MPKRKNNNKKRVRRHYMTNQEQLGILKEQGVKAWNQWREEHPEIHPDFTEADLREAYLRNANLEGADLTGADLREAYLRRADLRGADLKDANLEGANLRRAILRGANLEGTNTNLRRTNLSMADLEGTNTNLRRTNLRRTNLSEAIIRNAHLEGADLTGANLEGADLTGADLTGANLSGAVLVETTLRGANLTRCVVYGISVWNAHLEGITQDNLVITPEREQIITVDNLEVAQFIYLLLNNPKIRDVIDTIGQKGVLILGRFTPERKAVLDAIREKLRSLNFLPIVFDFERPTTQDFTETIMTLAGLSCFIIADITNPKSSPLELQATVPNYMIPFIPIIQEGEQPFSMFQDLEGKFDWVLDVLVYDTPSNLIKGLERAVVKPALEMSDELLSKKVEQLRTRHIEDYL